jgi:hypothetical protein
MLAVQTLRKTRFLNLYFHPWEFTDIKRYNLPGYIKKQSGPALVDKLHRLIHDLKKEGTFETIHNFIQRTTNQPAKILR